MAAYLDRSDENPDESSGAAGADPAAPDAPSARLVALAHHHGVDASYDPGDGRHIPVPAAT